MTMKKGARSVRKGIFEHQKRTSPIYEQMAEAPVEFREQFLHSFRNPLVRRYAAQRIESAAQDIALRRMANAELDPYPYVHDHVGCIVHGQRTDTQDAHDVFQPREGFVNDESAYQEQ